VPDPCESDTSLSFIVPEGSSNTFHGATTSGYFAVFDSVLGLFEVVESGQATSMAGTICIVPSDIDGNPSGEWTGMGIVFADPFDNSLVMDLSNLDGVTLSEEVDSGAAPPSSLFFIDGAERTSIEIPNLAGSNDSLVIQNCADLEDVIVPAGVKFKRITVSQCGSLTEASVDALCNALDATATGQASTISAGVGEGPAPTGDSLANRNAYIANGNTLDVFP
jgi:hypothetical protein